MQDIEFSYALPYSLTGWPCVVVRAGTSSEGLPIGVQVVARPWREDVALAVARLIETIFGGWQHPPTRRTGNHQSESSGRANGLTESISGCFAESGKNNAVAERRGRPQHICA